MFDKFVSHGKTDGDSDPMSGFTAPPRGAHCLCGELSPGPGDINLPRHRPSASQEASQSAGQSGSQGDGRQAGSRTRILTLTAGKDVHDRSSRSVTRKCSAPNPKKAVS